MGRYTLGLVLMLQAGPLQLTLRAESKVLGWILSCVKLTTQPEKTLENNQAESIFPSQGLHYPQIDLNQSVF